MLIEATTKEWRTWPWPSNADEHSCLGSALSSRGLPAWLFLTTVMEWRLLMEVLCRETSARLVISIVASLSFPNYCDLPIKYLRPTLVSASTHTWKVAWVVSIYWIDAVSKGWQKNLSSLLTAKFLCLLFSQFSILPAAFFFNENKRCCFCAVSFQAVSHSAIWSREGKLTWRQVRATYN